MAALFDVMLLSAAAALGWAGWTVSRAEYGAGRAGEAKLALRRAYKGAMRRVTGQCEIERVCLALRDEPQAVLTAALERSFELSAQLAGLRRDLRKESLDVGLAATNVLAIKPLPRGAEGEVLVARRVRSALESVHSVNRLVARLEAERAVPYRSENEEHEDLLRRLWAALRPGVPLEARVTDQWSEIGFQGRDPATDFRGMGVLGLQNLVWFAENRTATAREVLADTAREAWFSFAITGINLTADLVRMARERRLNQYFYTRGATLDSFCRLYAVVFSRFNAAWERDAPATVMEFGRIHAAFVAQIADADEAGELAHYD